MRVTIRQVAELAGVSVATISRVVNGGSGVSPELQKRVQDVIKATGYQPSMVARGLARDKTNIFAFLCSNLANLFYPELARGVQDEANLHGYQIIMCNTDDNPDKELEYLRFMEQLRVAGVIFASVLLDHPEGVKRMVESGAPCVLVNRRLEDYPVDYVVVNNVKGGMEATEHLIARGHTRIGFIGGPDNTSNSRERLQGYRLALEKHGLPFNESLVRKTNFQQQEAYRAALELLALENRPTAIFVQNDYLCLRAVDAILERALRVPEDIALVSFDGTSIASSKALRLTTVSQRISDMGRRAVQILVNKNKHPELRERHQIVFEPELVIRESSGVVLR